MNFLVNCSNLKAGGGLQVADSICCQLNKIGYHQFIVVLSSFLSKTKAKIKDYDNVKVFSYDISNSFSSIVLGRDQYLDRLVIEYNVDKVLTVFGPSRWRPQVPHLSGFALPQLIFPDSPFFQRMRWDKRIKWLIWGWVRKWSLARSADAFWTENEIVSVKLKSIINNKDVYTVTNYYNQVFDKPELWNTKIVLPHFDGITCLSVSSPTNHKNFSIIEDVVRYLRLYHPDFKVRFVLTFSPNDWSMDSDIIDSILYLGKIDVSECPSLYMQSDIMFMPSLLECFTATYPEAMRMEVPIVTTDLVFARGLCGDAACYYNAIDGKSAAEAIYRVATDKEYAHRLVENGKRKLLEYDNYEERVNKLINILLNVYRAKSA